MCPPASLLYEAQSYHCEPLQGKEQRAVPQLPSAQERINSPQSLRSDFSE